MNYYDFNSPDSSPDGSIDLWSTSSQTARARSVNLREPTSSSRLRFEPLVVDNPNNPENSVRGRIVYERKKKAEEHFPSENGDKPVSKSTLKQEGYLSLELSSSEMRELYKVLQQLYKLHSDIGAVQMGWNSYVQVDNALRSVIDLLRDDPSSSRLLSNPDTFQLVKELLKILTQGRTHDELEEVLSSLEDESLSNLSAGITLESLTRAVNDMRSNLDNRSEEFWQSELLEQYPWVIGQVFATPCVLFESKAYVGGKSIFDGGGNVVDFAYQNSLTKNLVLVEIKTPLTSLLGRRYRNHSYSLSGELTGAVIQVLSYKQSLLNHFHSLRMDSPSDTFEAFSPRCVIIIGSLSELKDPNGDLDRDKLSSFENFRNSLTNVTIVTYDELITRTEDLINILSHNNSNYPKDSLLTVSTPDSFDDLPF